MTYRKTSDVEGLVYIPASDVEQIREGGAPAREADGVTFLRQEGDRSIFQLSAGSYTFKVSSK